MKLPFLLCALGVTTSVSNAFTTRLARPSTRPGSAAALRMATYSVEKGVLAQLVEERDACGVGFIASLNNEADHSVVEQALAACTCMEHRGASSADNVSGDGTGVMTAIPWDLFSGMCNPAENLNKDGSASCAVGMVFLPKPKDQFDVAHAAVESIVKNAGLVLAGWRDVPVNPTVLGTLSAEFVPLIKQVVIKAAPGKAYESEAAFEKVLYDVRREIQGTFRLQGQTNAYVCSLSSKTVVYKGMLRACDLGLFYRDLKDPNYKTPFAIYHRRFSTNTVPKWFLAQPFRMLAHNGEINTLLGNINWVKSRYGLNPNKAPTLQDKREEDLRVVRGPLVDVGRSDSANLDSILDSFVKAGKTPQEALMILVPEAFDSQPKLQDAPAVKAFYEYYESMQEAWDGPALLVFSDGNSVGAALDRNGLRPARFMMTKNAQGKEHVHVMSEVGVTKILNQFSDDASASNNGVRLIQSGRLGPGEMLSVNLKEGKVYLNDEVRNSFAFFLDVPPHHLHRVCNLLDVCRSSAPSPPRGRTRTGRRAPSRSCPGARSWATSTRSPTVTSRTRR